MVNQNNNMHDDDDLSEADKAVLRLYRDAKPAIEWDDSDDAILSFARSAARTDDVEEESSTAPEPEAESSTVVPFRRPEPKAPPSVFRSPLAGLAIAASLMIGVFVGQGVTPYVDLGVSRDYAGLVEDNQRLTREVARYSDFGDPQNYSQVMEENTRLQAEIEGLRGLDSGSAAAEIGTPLEGAAGFSELTELLGSFDCSAFNLSVAEGSRVIIDGYVSRPADITRLQQGLLALAPAANVSNRAVVVEAPFCGALEVLHEHTEVGDGLRGAPSVRPFDHGLSYVKGESLIVAATATSRYDGYLYVDVVSPDGRVRHLMSDAGEAAAAARAGQEVVFGEGEGGHLISEPLGRELTIAISTPTPLFDETRPDVELSDEYFPELAAALQSLGVQGPTPTLLSSYLFVNTRAAE